MRAGESAQVLLDDTAKADYHRLLADLQDDLEEARAFDDVGRASLLQDEIDELVAALAAAAGLGGRDRLAASATERARVNVTRVVRAAIATILHEHPALGVHLTMCVSTGRFCSYALMPGSHGSGTSMPEIVGLEYSVREMNLGRGPLAWRNHRLTGACRSCGRAHVWRLG